MENFKKKVKEIWTKVKTKAVEIFKIVKEWVIAHKVASIIIASVLAVAIILAIVLPIALSDCKHKDKFLEVTETPATCTTAGTKVTTCTKCDTVVKEEALPVVPHTWNEGVVTTEPTCAAGVKTFTCTECQGTKTEEIAATAEHTWVDATCTAPKTCSECGATEGEVAEHTPVDVEAVAPTCVPGTTAGKKCSVCDTVLEGIEEVPATAEHTEVAVDAVAPTCTEKGATAGKKCSECGTVLEGIEEVEALGHTWNEGVVTTEPTCVAGVKTFTCTVCGETKTEEIAATGEHTEVAVDAVAPTCTEKGATAGKKCSECGTVLEGIEEVEALGHTWDDGVVTTEPTCVAGVKTYTCSVCQGTKEEEIPAVAEHTSVDVDAVAPTCTEKGATAGKKCSECGTVLEGIEEVEANGHTEEVVAAVAPTCTATGLTEGKKCSVCDTVIVAQEVVEANGHTEEVVAAVAPTCTATGLTEGKKCSVCDTVIVAQEVVAVIDHEFETTEQIVVVEGVAYYVEDCANCDATQNVAIENAVVVTDPAALTIESGKTYVLTGEAAYDITLAGELSNVTIVGGKATCIKVDANAVIDGLTIKDVSFATEGGDYFFNKNNAAVVKNVVFDGCTFDGTNLSNNVINIWTDVENLTVNACEFKNLDWNTLPIMLNGTTLGEVNITNNVADNFAQRFVRVANAQTGTITITGNTLTNWMYIPDAECNNDGVEDTNDAEIFKASTTTATIVIGEGNTLDGEAIGELVTEDDGDQVVYADKTNEEETPDYVAPEGGAQE